MQDNALDAQQLTLTAPPAQELLLVLLAIQHSSLKMEILVLLALAIVQLAQVQQFAQFAPMDILWIPTPVQPALYLIH